MISKPIVGFHIHVDRKGEVTGNITDDYRQMIVNKMIFKKVWASVLPENRQ